MKSLRSIVRKSAKRRAQRRDYERRHNINRNVPCEVKEEKKEIFRSLHRLQPDGRPALEHAGYKTVRVKLPLPRLHAPGDRHEPMVDAIGRAIPMIAYPMPRKYRAAVVK